MSPTIASPRGSSIELDFFPSGDRSLFGCLHRPRGAAVGKVVLVPAFGHEYSRSHRAFRQMADRFSRAGWCALRFDLSGCGDSSGQTGVATIENWRNDVVAAVARVEEESDGPLILVGRRLGAAPALSAASAIGGVDGLALWDPVVRGADYLNELETLHRDWLEAGHGRQAIRLASNSASETLEYLGQPVHPDLREQIGALDLTADAAEPPGTVCLIDSREPSDPAVAELGGALQAAGAEVTSLHLVDAEGWVIDGVMLKQLVPLPILKEVVAWASRWKR